MPNPVIAEVTRGGVVESRHTGAYAVVDASDKLIASAGDITQAVFPRSAVKAFQCLPLIESGAADHFGFNDEELALACASHNGEAGHIRVASNMLAKAGLS
jgi:L-asparaginase II